MTRTIRRLATLLAATALAVGVSTVAAAPANAAVSCTINSSGVALSLQNLRVTPGYQSTCVQFRFAYLRNGNVVISFNGTTVWQTNQANRPSTHFTVRSTGNVAQYNGSRVIYNARTAGNLNAKLVARFSNGAGSVSVVRTNGTTVKTLSSFTVG